jgi:outer membrane protein OmpA-like peptidoglycan-associated protein
MPRKFIVPAALVVLLAACASEPKPYIVFFATDAQNLTPEGRKLVHQIAAQAAAEHPARIEIEGQADGATSDQTVLAQARADTVAHALVEAGIDAKSIDSHAGAPAEGQTDVAARKVTVTLVQP